MSATAAHCLLLLALLGLTTPSPLPAREGPADAAVQEPAAEAPASTEDEPQDEDPKKKRDPSTLANLCDMPELGSGAWIDRMHRAVYRSVCGSAVWFDNFFGQEEADDEREATFGRLGLGLQWSDHEDFDVRTRFKVKMHLPRFEKRVNAFFGSYKEDEFAPDRPRSFGNLPEVFRDTDQEWLAGLGYSPARGKRKRIDVDAGVRLGFPMDPFVRVRFRRYHFLHDATLVRFRQTLFWRGEKGVGTTTHVDLERVLAPRFHLRWRNLGTLAESIEGVDWESGLTLFHYLGGNRAIAYEVRFEGETDAEVPVEEYGVRAVYRQSVLRDWFFIELRGGISWPRTELAEARNESAGVGFGFELLFGDHP